MVDLNKEIKLGDLFRRRAKEPERPAGATPQEETPKKERRPLFARGRREATAGEPTPAKEARPKKERRRRGAGNPAVEPRPAAELPSIPLMRAFDLLPKEPVREKGGRAGLVRLGIALLGILVVGGLGGAYLFTSSGVSSKQSELDDLRAQLAELEVPAEAPAAGEAALAGEGMARKTALSSALASRIAWDRVLREVSLVVPEGVWLTQLAGTTPNGGSAGTGAPAPPAAPTGSTSPNSLSVTGFATSQESVAVLLSRLAAIPELTAVQLQSSTRNDAEFGPVYSFSILTAVDPLGRPAS
ncbi:MAG TPA: PilN domain-containing protein [Gaiellaceae bacterium]|nr:PilN domain-containing protein [Gaiellaceae bacterium]